MISKNLLLSCFEMARLAAIVALSESRRLCIAFHYHFVKQDVEGEFFFLSPPYLQKNVSAIKMFCGHPVMKFFYSLTSTSRQDSSCVLKLALESHAECTTFFVLN